MFTHKSKVSSVKSYNKGIVKFSNMSINKGTIIDFLYDCE